VTNGKTESAGGNVIGGPGHGKTFPLPDDDDEWYCWGSEKAGPYLYLWDKDIQKWKYQLDTTNCARIKANYPIDMESARGK
jgi:hypothetical protein